MNKKNNGLSNTKGMRDPGKYGVPEDHKGRSPLTGRGFIKGYFGKFFTCKELEVFAL